MNSILKYCPKCKQQKPIDTGFHKHASRYDGASSICRRCKSHNKKKFDANEKGLKYCPKCNRAVSKKEFIRESGKTSGYCFDCRTSDEKKKTIELTKNGLKFCPNCNQEKQFSSFHKSSIRKDGLNPYCKKCERKKGKAKYKNNAEKINMRHSKNYYEKQEYYREKHKEWYNANPSYSQHRAIKRRALERKAEGSYTQEEFETLCQHYGNICLCCGKKKKLTVDHIVPLSKGGKNSIDNIQPLCLRCNQRKATKTIDYRFMEQASP